MSRFTVELGPIELVVPETAPLVPTSEAIVTVSPVIEVVIPEPPAIVLSLIHI